MREVSLREFRTRGANALKTVPQGETILLAGQRGPAYFLVPVQGDVATEERELRRAIAKASLRKSWRIAEQAGLNTMNDAEIEAEIASVRNNRRRRKAK